MATNSAHWHHKSCTDDDIMPSSYYPSSLKLTNKLDGSLHLLKFVMFIVMLMNLKCQIQWLQEAKVRNILRVHTFSTNIMSPTLMLALVTVFWPPCEVNFLYFCWLTSLSLCRLRTSSTASRVIVTNITKPWNNKKQMIPDTVKSHDMKNHFQKQLTLLEQVMIVVESVLINC